MDMEIMDKEDIVATKSAMAARSLFKSINLC